MSRTHRELGYSGCFACEGLPPLDPEDPARASSNKGAIRLTREDGFGW